jgi:hypothetical protein
MLIETWSYVIEKSYKLYIIVVDLHCSFNNVGELTQTHMLVMKSFHLSLLSHEADVLLPTYIHTYIHDSIHTYIHT